MNFAVAKIGRPMIDALHTYGLGILLAYISKSPVVVTDKGATFGLISEKINCCTDPIQCINDILQLPSTDALSVSDIRSASSLLTVRNLDGILAIRFTSPGLRTPSVQDMLERAKYNSKVIERAVLKATTAVQKYVSKTRWIARGQSHWIDHVLKSYTIDQPTIPIPVIRNPHMISIPMPIDSAFSYSTRRQLSDGLVTDKSNISFANTPYAPILIIIGATRFLRACPINGNLVLFCMPIVETVSLSAETALPLLASRSQPMDQALAQQWLDRAHEQAIPGGRWTGMAYQVMQSQHPQQSISQSCGFLSYAWLQRIEQRAGRSVIKYWQKLLSIEQKDLCLELDNLIDMLLYHRATSLKEHLRDIGRVYKGQGTLLRCYELSEVQEIGEAMPGDATSSLCSVLERKQGTQRFGQALRLLGRFNLTLLRDIVDALDSVRTRNSLIRVLAQAVQACTVASAKTPFIIIPDDDDLLYLLDDIGQYGVEDVAGILIILSALHYPRVNIKESGNDGGAVADE